MKCPNCENRQIEISLHSGGMVSGETPIKECPECHHVWTCDARGVIKVLQYGCYSFSEDSYIPCKIV